MFYSLGGEDAGADGSAGRVPAGTAETDWGNGHPETHHPEQDAALASGNNGGRANHTGDAAACGQLWSDKLELRAAGQYHPHPTPHDAWWSAHESGWDGYRGAAQAYLG